MSSVIKIIRLVFENNDTNNIQWTGTPTPPVGITTKDVDIQDENGTTISVPMKLELDDNGRVKLAYTDPGAISAIKTSITSTTTNFDINQEEDFTVQSIPDFSFNGVNPVARRKFKTTVLHSGIFIEADIDDKGNPKYDVDISSDQKITFYVLRDTIENVTKLPAQSKHG